MRIKNAFSWVKERNLKSPLMLISQGEVLVNQSVEKDQMVIISFRIV